MIHGTCKEEPLHIAMVARRVHPAHGPGGLERHVYELTCRLARAGLKIDLITEAPRDPAVRANAEASFPDSVVTHWIQDRWLPIGEKPGTIVLDRVTNYPLWSWKVARHMVALRGEEFCSGWSVVHIHGLAGWGLARASKRGLFKNPLVLTTQGLEEFRSHSWMKHLAYSPFRACMRTVAAESNAVVATDVSLQPLVEQHLKIPTSNQVVIVNAVDPIECRRLANPGHRRELVAKLGLDQAFPLLLSVGRLAPNKGFEMVPRALASAAQRLPSSWTWVLAGEGAARRTIEDSVMASGIASHCVLAGRLTDEDLHNLYSVADWFIHPTLYEGSSIVTLEAMAHGLPVIVSNTGGLPDKVEEGVTGFLVPPGNLDALAEALINTRKVDGKTFGEAGRQICEVRFSWDAVTRQYIALYKSLARMSPII